MADLDTLYDRLGEDGLDQLTAGFYRRVREDELLRPMYPPDDWDAAQARLRDFLIQRFGGPTRYSDQRGHPRLRMRHSPYAIGREARDQWMRHMIDAIGECAIAEDDAEALIAFFDMVATHMMNRPD